MVFLFTGDKNPFLGQNPWDLYLKSGFLGISSFLFPMFVILLVALIVNLENKNNTWKKMYVLPFSRDLLYIGKFSFVLAMVVLSILFFMILQLLLGWSWGIVDSSSNMLSKTPDIVALLGLGAKTILSVLGIFSFQYFVCQLFKNSLIPICIGFFLFIIALSLSETWEYSHYLFISAPMEFFASLRGATVDQVAGLQVSEWGSLFAFLLFLIAGGLFNRYRSIT